MWQQLNILRTNGKITPLYVGVRLLASKRFFNFSVLWSYSQKESLNCLQLRRLSTIVKRRVTSVRARPLVILRGLIQALSRAQLTQEAEWDLAAKLCRSLCVEKKSSPNALAASPRAYINYCLVNGIFYNCRRTFKQSQPRAVRARCRWSACAATRWWCPQGPPPPRGPAGPAAQTTSCCKLDSQSLSAAPLRI